MFLLIIFVDYICNFELIKVCFCNYEVIVHKHTYTREADAFEIIFEIKISIVVIFSLSDSSLETAFSIFCD